MWIKTDTDTLRCVETGAIATYRKGDRFGPASLRLDYPGDTPNTILHHGAAEQLWEYLCGLGDWGAQQGEEQEGEAECQSQ